MDDTWIQLLVQAGAVGILAVFLYLFITKVLPGFMSELNKQRGEFLAALSARDDKFERTLINMNDGHNKSMDKLTQGVNEQTRLMQDMYKSHRAEQATSSGRKIG